MKTGAGALVLALGRFRSDLEMLGLTVAGIELQSENDARKLRHIIAAELYVQQSKALRSDPEIDGIVFSVREPWPGA